MQLSIEDIGKSFPGVTALDGVSFTIRPGEIHALMGENGAGKSTLIKIITGLYKPDRGRLLVDGKEVAFSSPRDAIAAGISAVHQERNLIPRFTVGENIVIERLPTKGGLIDYGAVHREARRFLDMIDPSIDTHTEVRRLSVAQMQIVEIAKALSLETGVLLLDEPTASITGHETEALFAVLRRLRDEGKAIVFVSHKLEEVVSICDRVTVLRDGRVAAAGEPIATMGRGRIVSAMIGREERVAEIGERRLEGAKPVLEARAIATSLGHRDVSFTLRKGEILGLYGLVGAGRTELARALIGDARILSGGVVLRGEKVSIGSVPEAIRRHRLGYISEDRKAEGLILAHPIRSNIVIPIWRRIAGRLGLISRAGERRVAVPLAQRLEVKAPSIEQAVGKLSGGNQQKVSIAKWLAAGVDILIIDEPTVGIDIKTKTAIHELIGEITRSGVSVLLISSDMPEMITLADRILVMKDFAIRGEIENTRRYEAMSQAIMAHIHDAEGEAAPREAGHG
ncbi:sugar ABC transporter ATP-binding protein [Kaistia geumhonensis]|uniref:Ribose transport system ATP-binding protein n=1 Tax=Kaistia geumhonensis TaxID=410839 RepID=A0ABU0MAU5_9HYPH|nr:sugar ABC transporter ATP-binding protein [Kaistia geumhonensis]MCX5481030.1 sugar ABC transporter ATP-binding protein [Kaistia geumhonensis]MDQ0518089.1 ribose transport system ATP-binding protein [Kaistia geumhonensis]